MSCSIYLYLDWASKLIIADCGVTHTTDEEIIKNMSERVPEAKEDLKKIDFGCFTEAEFEETIKKDVKKLRAEKLLSGMDILGFKLDTFTGKIEQVDV